MRNVKKILDYCSKPCVVHVLCLLPLFSFYFLLNWNGQGTRVFVASNTIHGINQYPAWFVLSTTCYPPLDSDLSGGYVTQPSNIWGLYSTVTSSPNLAPRSISIYGLACEQTLRGKMRNHFHPATKNFSSKSGFSTISWKNLGWCYLNQHGIHRGPHPRQWRGTCDAPNSNEFLSSTKSSTWSNLSR